MPGRGAVLEGRKVRETCWTVFQGRNGFTRVCGTLQEHNLWVIRALGIRNQRFWYQSRALACLAEQAEEVRLQAGLRAEEEAYADANTTELDREERVWYKIREAWRLIAMEQAAQADEGGEDMATDQR